ncbi:MAG: hypothetical protein KZQ93_16325 [Candidatus Thiodiazotropha sp. (ex Monitilora ramsayi)]|nr:hypothetical protein [Candidatus Thiodiazotropha sp. (ex Monitilora ramsayi)]
MKHRSALIYLPTIIVTALTVSLFYYQHTLAIITASGERAGLTITHTFLNSLDTQLLNFLRQAGANEYDSMDSFRWTELDRQVRRVMAKTGVAKIKIYNRSGLTIYSTEHSQIGEDQQNNHGFQSALMGAITSSLVYRNTFNGMDGVIEDKDLIQTYTPVSQANGYPADLGVFELYTDVSLLVKQLESTRFQVIVAILAALLFLFLVHFWLSQKAQGIINRQSASIDKKSRALKYSESLASSLFDSIQEKILLASKDGKILRVNRFARQTSSVDLTGNNVVDLFNDEVSDMELSNALQAIKKTFNESVPQRGVLTMDWQDKNRALSLDTYPVVGPDDCTEQIILYLRDITDERNRQIRACHEDKLIGLGALAAGYAHDLVNPIASLSSELELMDPNASSREIEESLDTQRYLLQRISRIVTGMRDSFRRTQVENSSTSIPEAINATLHRVRHEAAINGVTIETEFPSSLRPAPIAHDHLIMVLYNLATNAIQAMPNGGVIFMRAEELDSGDLQIIVRDDGLGMKAEDIQLSLGTLYTTKPDGLGLGLTVSQELIRSVGGRLLLTSELGKGTTVKIIFPNHRVACFDDQDEFRVA